MESKTSTSSDESMEDTTSNDKAMENKTSTSICESGVWKWYETFPTHEVVIEEMAKIVYTTCEIQKNDSRVQYKMADNLNYMCTELNTDADSNQTKKMGPSNENGVVGQGQLRNFF